MGRAAGWEIRAVALLRARVFVVGTLCSATLLIAGALAWSLGDGQASEVPEVLLISAVLLPTVVCHGVVSGDLRSGVALLWLQKPVEPVRFYMRRGLDVCVLSLVLQLALCGAGALVATLGSGAGGGRLVLLATPMTLVWAICIGVVVVSASAWGTQLDGLVPLCLLYLTALGLLDQGLLGDLVAWIGVPLEAIATLGRGVAAGVGEGVGTSLARVARFLLLWVLFGVLGLLVTTRSPLPREVAR
jgi:hypothetical protein